MRTTLDIADDVLEAARARARRDGRTLGETLSDLARRALTASVAPAGATVLGFRPFAARGELVTNERIDALRADDAC
jgi:hypothetical protein